MPPNNPPSSSQERRRWREVAQLLGPDIAPTALQLMEEMRLVAHALKRIGENSLAGSGLSYAQYRVLMSLFLAEHHGERDDLNPSEISQLQGTSRNTISALIRNLERDGLVERHLDQADRRRFNISLTPAGRELVKQHARQHLEAIGRCFAGLTQEEQVTLRSLLRKLGRASRPLREDPQAPEAKAAPTEEG